jgi:hypothetical protein
MTDSSGGVDGHDRYSTRTNAAPTTTKRISGTVLATTAASTSRAPPLTLRMLIAAAADSTSAMSAPLTRAEDVPMRAAAEAANADATNPADASALSRLSTPVKKPGSGPSATST